MGKMLALFLAFVGNCVGLTPTAPPPPEVCEGSPTWQAPARSVVRSEALSAAGFDAYGYPRATLDRREPLELLLARDFEGLERLLAEIDQAVREDLHREIWLWDAYKTFDSESEAIGKAVAEWVQERDASVPAHLAAATWNTGQGWARRGSGWANQTSSEQFSGMRDSFAVAAEHIAFVLERDPASLWGARLAIGIAKAKPGAEGLEALSDALLAHNPESFLLRHLQMVGSAPRWGGSHELMQAAMVDASSHFASFPELRTLCGFAHWDSAQPRSKADKIAMRPIWEAALEYGELPAFSRPLAIGHRKAGEPHRAEAVAKAALASRPQHRELLMQYANALLEQHRFREAEAVRDLILEFDPGYQHALGWSTWASKMASWWAGEEYKAERFERAASLYGEAIQLDPNDTEHLYWRGRSHSALGMMRQALPDYEEAARREPGNLRYAKELAHVLERMGRFDDIVDGFSRYLQNRPDDPEGLAMRGLALHLAGRASEARADLEAACAAGAETGCAALREHRL